MDLVSFLEGLPPASLSEVYAAPFTAAALFRALPPVAKQYVMRLLFVDKALAGAVVSSWANPAEVGKHAATLGQLQRLAVLARHSDRLGTVSYSLNPMFRGQLRRAVCSSLDPAAEKLPQEVEAAAPSPEEADEHARRQWEALLLYLGASSDAPPGLPRELVTAGQQQLDVPSLLLAAGLLLKDELGGPPAISDAGFSFLLADTYGQLWAVLRQYIADAQAASGAALASVISFLLQLGLQGRRPVQYAVLGPLEQRVAAHMAQLGLLLPFRPDRTDLWLLPTRLAAVMAGSRASSGGAGPAGAAGEDGFIIVESNFRVYAYTTSAVQVSILRLFVRCDVLLPNLFVGTITRDSAMEALRSGIGAKAVIGYLRSHAHPRVQARAQHRRPIVPEVVSDQLELWHAELHRLKSDRATSYFAFESEELYRRVEAAAKRMNALLVAVDDQRKLVVAAWAHDQMRAEIKRLKEQLGV